MTRRLDLPVPESLWDALQERARATGRSIDWIVRSALAEALDLDHHALFQVSTSGALVEGLYQGAMTVGELRQHGDTGLGTFEDLDGEMILLEGRCYQARSDGRVTEAPDSARTPFATVVLFAPDATAVLEDIGSFGDFTARLDTLRASDNEFVSWRMRGHFESLRMRTACKHVSGTPLVEAIADQAVFEAHDIAATIVGFWSPAFTQAIAIPGYHLHAISDDRRCGGHVFDLRARRIDVEVNLVSDLRFALPETRAFLEADLSGDSTEAIASAEHEQG